MSGGVFETGGVFPARSGKAAAAPEAKPYSIAEDARETFAAEHDVQRRDEQRRDWLGTFGQTALMVAVVGAAMLYVFLLVNTRPFRYWDTVCVVTVALLPVELVLACFFVQDHPLAVAAAMARAGARANGLGGWLKLATAVLVLNLLLPVNGVLYLNQVLDRSAPVSQALLVQRVWSQDGRGGPSWYAGVVPPTRSPLRFASFYADQPIRVSRRTWRTLEPGRSTLTLTVHAGAFGLPWYDLR